MDDEPDKIVVDWAVMLTVTAGLEEAATVTIAVAEVLPPVPVAVAV
jgi:hypothetical protein